MFLQQQHRRGLVVLGKALGYILIDRIWRVPHRVREYLPNELPDPLELFIVQLSIQDSIYFFRAN